MAGECRKLPVNIDILCAFGVYVLALIGVGFFAYFKNKSLLSSHNHTGHNADFMLGSRSLNFWITALSANASDMSNWLFMGYPAMIYLQGLSQAWVVIGLVIFGFLNWHFIAPKIRYESERTNTLTLSGYFSARFHDQTGVIRGLSGMLLISFFIIYISAMLHGIGKIFDSTLGVNYEFSIAMSIVVILLYTIVGGFISVAWTDAFQAVFLLAMILLVPFVALKKIGGWHVVLAAARARGEMLSLVPQGSITGVVQGMLVMLGWGLGYFGMPHIQTKFMGIDNPKEMYKSKYVSLVWVLLAFAAASTVGLIGISFFPNGLIDSELVFVDMVQVLFSPFMTGIILCAILAATISSIDSMVLVIATILTEDVYHHMLHPHASKKRLMAVFRYAIFGVCFVSAIIALARISSVYALVEYAWTGLGASFGPLLIATLYSPWVTKQGAIAGIVTGGLVAACWQPATQGIVCGFFVPGMVVSFCASFLVMYAVSKLTKH